jgi:enoyl-CoA hydratase/carnithine racemase
VTRLTLDNPDRLGALNTAMRSELAAHWDAIRGDPDVRAVVLTGTGRGFSTGLDLQAADAGDDPASMFPDADQLPRFGLSPLEHDVWQPYIVAINGVCAGGGFHLLTDADVVIASTTASFVDPHVSVGQVSALEPIALARRLPLEAVLRMVVLGAHGRISADDALRLGLVGEIVQPGRLVERAVQLASFAAEGSPAAIETSKRAIWQSFQVGLDEGLQGGWERLRAHWMHPDCREGIEAFAQGRMPKWQSRPDCARTVEVE